MAKLNEDDIVLATVTRIQGNTVFLEIEVEGEKIEGTMIFAEVSPGRIRNIREFVSPGKKVACKVLRIKGNHVELSLRRVTGKEREEMQERHKKSMMLNNMLKTVFKDKTLKVLDKIKEKYEPSEFLDEARENPDILKLIAKNSELEQLKKIFAEKREKEKEVKKTISLKSHSESGLYDIQQTLSEKEENLNIYYEGSSRFSIVAKAKTYKDANSLMEKTLDKIKQNSKKHHVQLEIKEK